MSHVYTAGLCLALLITIGCTKQDPEISLLGFSSLRPSLTDTGPYIVNDTHFNSDYTIIGECSPQITNLKIKINDEWTPLLQQLTSSDADCSDNNFKINFKLGELGFIANQYKTKSLWLKSTSDKGDSEPQQISIQYIDPTLPVVATKPDFNITYNNNNKISVNWNTNTGHSNEALIVKLQTGQTGNSCGSGTEHSINQGQLSGTLSLESEVAGVNAFDLNSQDITISICGKSLSGEVSAPTNQVYYRTPGNITYTPEATDVEVKLNNIASDGMTFFTVQFGTTSVADASCSTADPVLQGVNYTKPGLSASTTYYFKICAYNQNTPAQKSETAVFLVTTKNAQPATPLAVTVERRTAEKKINLNNLDPTKIYFIDYKTDVTNLETDPNQAVTKNHLGNLNFIISPFSNKKYYFRIWEYDNMAQNKFSLPHDLSIWSYIHLEPRHPDHSILWGKQIVNSNNNPHEMSDFTQECTASDINAAEHSNKCVNAGLLWHLPLAGSNICNTTNLKITFDNNGRELPLHVDCIQNTSSAEYQITGIKNNFRLKDFINMVGGPNFEKINLKLHQQQNQAAIISENFEPLDLWSNELTVITTGSTATYSSTSDDKVLIIDPVRNTPITINGASNLSVISKDNDDFIASTSDTLNILNSKNLYLELSLKSSGSSRPLKIENSNNINIQGSNFHSSPRGVEIIDSNLINFSNTKFMNFENTTALLINNSKYISISNSQISNSFAAISFSNNTNVNSRLNISQTTLSAIQDKALDFLDEYSSQSQLILSHSTFKNNSYDSIYTSTKKQYTILNQALFADNDPDSFGLYASYNDNNSRFYFSQLGFKGYNDKQNIGFKHNVVSASFPSYSFSGKYLNSTAQTACHLVNSLGSFISNCDDGSVDNIDNLNFGDFFQPTKEYKTSLTATDWKGHDTYSYWLDDSSIRTCTSVSTTCSTYTAIMSRSASNLLDASKDFSSASSNGIYDSNGGFNDTNACTDTLNIEVRYTDPTSSVSTKYFIANAAEVNTDLIGNNNGLCESNETCVLSPNLGSYQGHFAGGSENYKSCNFNSSTNVLNVKILAYPLNGKD